MKQIFLVTSIAFLFACSEQVQKKEEPQSTEVETAVAPLEFDSLKAYEYGADDYGMKQYVMAFLKKGPNRDRDSLESYELQRAHLDNIGKMADEGKLVAAGPFLGDGDLRGIYIFNVKTVEEAEQLVATDPAIKAGSLTMELLPWYSSAALMEINELHKRLAKINI